MVEPASGALNQTSSEPELGAGVAAVVGVGVGLGVAEGLGVGEGVGEGLGVGEWLGVGVTVTVLRTVKLLMSILGATSLPVTTDLRWCVRVANLVVASTQWLA